MFFYLILNLRVVQNLLRYAKEIRKIFFDLKGWASTLFSNKLLLTKTQYYLPSRTLTIIFFINVFNELYYFM